MSQRTTHLLFDLDDTLYPASSGLFMRVSKRIHEYIRDALQLEPEAARKLQKEYWRTYGTSLYGLMTCHNTDPVPFLEYVHDVPVEEVLRPNPDLRAVLESLPHRRHVFTNGPAFYAHRVLRALAIDDLFEEMFDIERAGFVPKPNPEPYDRVVSALGEEKMDGVLIEDALKNLAPARARGWKTIWLRSPDSWLGGAAGLSLQDGDEEKADAVVSDLGEIAPVLERILSHR
jgi:putative hydrolase of the HAD superfamily